MRLVELLRVARRYGGIHAVDGVDFSVEAGEVRAIIGPNGAGKTTLVGLISGRIPPSSGRVRFAGQDITALPSWRRVMLGIVYTFQVTSIYRSLTCYENVALAAQRKRMGLGRSAEPAIAEAVRLSLTRVGLVGDSAREAGILPYGHQRLLEVAMALALDPKLIIFDEPTQGLAPAEIASFCNLVRELSRAMTVLVIEHNLRVVLELAHRITVMDRGTILAEGSPPEIERHPAVQRAYLGR
jgi:branched-chain amino acid transport system ATP-binding protein